LTLRFPNRWLIGECIGEGGRASEKVWKIRTGKIVFDLLKGEFELKRTALGQVRMVNVN